MYRALGLLTSMSCRTSSARHQGPETHGALLGSAATFLPHYLSDLEQAFDGTAN